MILAADWIFPVTSPPLFRHAIEVEQGTIRAIRPAMESDQIHKGVAIVPGLINTHTHLAYTAMRNRFDSLPFFPWIRALTKFKTQLSPEDVIASTRLGIAECLAGGITTVADLSDLEPALATLAGSPLRGNFYWEVFGVEKEHADRSWQSLREIFPRLREQHTTDKIRIGLSPHASYTVRSELYEKIAGFAVQNHCPVSFHLAESVEEEQFIGKQSGIMFDILKDRTRDWKRNGSTTISHLEATGIYQTHPLIAHVVQASPEDIDILARYDVAISHCPKSNAKFGHGIAPVRDLLSRGFRVGLGTDSAASNNRLDMFEEARFALLQQRNRYGATAMTEQQALELMTIRGAAAMGMENKAGSIEPGKFADFALIGIPTYYAQPHQVLHHLIHNTTARDVIRTYIGGDEVRYEAPSGPVEQIYAKPD